MENRVWKVEKYPSQYPNWNVCMYVIDSQIPNSFVPFPVPNGKKFEIKFWQLEDGMRDQR